MSQPGNDDFVTHITEGEGTHILNELGEEPKTPSDSLVEAFALNREHSDSDCSLHAERERRIGWLREKVKERIAKRESQAPRMVTPDPEPRYDDEFYAFVEWLNSGKGDQ
jgi:hypothetical protein